MSFKLRRQLVYYGVKLLMEFSYSAIVSAGILKLCDGIYNLQLHEV